MFRLNKNSLVKDRTGRKRRGTALGCGDRSVVSFSARGAFSSLSAAASNLPNGDNRSITSFVIRSDPNFRFTRPFAAAVADVAGASEPSSDRRSVLSLALRPSTSSARTALVLAPLLLERDGLFEALPTGAVAGGVYTDEIAFS